MVKFQRGKGSGAPKVDLWGLRRLRPEGSGRNSDGADGSFLRRPRARVAALRKTLAGYSQHGYRNHTAGYIYIYTSIIVYIYDIIVYIYIYRYYRLYPKPYTPTAEG